MRKGTIEDKLLVKSGISEPVREQLNHKAMSVDTEGTMGL